MVKRDAEPWLGKVDEVGITNKAKSQQKGIALWGRRELTLVPKTDPKGESEFCVIFSEKVSGFLM